ncbi:MAG: AAA family ATPase [Spirochaetaceae bacterium]|jgi:hypothetical protein|nr:AAA family ATPase [Spirochaetaceae bacterium]
MGVNINTTELIKVLAFTPPNQNIMLVGRHGIGKSRIITDFFEGRGKKVVSLFLGQMSDPGDLIGLPALDSDLTKTDFRPPYWFPLDGRPIVLFLDELNRARPEILQCVMDLTLNRSLAGKRLPHGSQIVSAVNEGEEYQLTDLDPALVSRFNVYHFSPSCAEWLLWAAAKGIDARIVSFIEKNSDCLDGETGIDAGLDKTADRRSWERVSEIIKTEDAIDRTLEKLIAGIVGVKAAFRFTNFLKENSGVSSAMILNSFEECKSDLEELSVHELSGLNEGFFRVVELEENPDTVKNYTANLEKYIRWLNDTGRGEALAHWITVYEGNVYPKTKVAVLSYSPYIFQIVIDYVKNIKL